MTPEIIDTILTHYGLPPVISFSKIDKGFISHNYKVETQKGTFFLKQFPNEKVAPIESIEKAEIFFAEHKIPVVVPIKTLKGNLHIVIDDTQYVLYPFVDGIHYVGSDLSKNALAGMAEVLADIHLLTKDGINGEYKEFSYFKFKPKEEIILEIDIYLSIIKKIDLKSDFDILAQKTLELKKKLINECDFKPVSPELSDRHLCHGDYHSGNIFFDSNDKVSYVFDLAMSGPAPRMYEVVRSIMLTCFNHEYTSTKKEQAKIFLAAYKKKYPFSKHELKEALESYHIKQFWGIWIERAHYKNGITRTDVLYEPNVNTIHYLLNNRDQLFKELSLDLF